MFPPGARHVIDTLNSVSGPATFARKTWPKELALKQSKSVSGALPRSPDPLAGELQPVLAAGAPFTYEGGFVQKLMKRAARVAEDCAAPLIR